MESRRAAAFVINDPKGIKFVADNDTQIDGAKLGPRPILTAQIAGNRTNIVLRWTNEAAAVQNVSIKAILNFKSDNLETYNYVVIPPP
jgi:hypothetical protein